MSKEILYNLLNEKMIELMTNLISAFPDLNDFKLIKKGTIMLSTLDYKNPYKIFRDYVNVKYKEQIMNKDDAFFLNTVEYEIYDQENKDYWKDFIEQLKRVWVTLDDTNKENIWKYLQIFVALCSKIEDAAK